MNPEAEIANGSRPAQVDAGHYATLKYLNLVRSITHWHQAAAIADTAPLGSSILEIGPGTGHTTWLLRKLGHRVTTLDIAADLNPDLVGDITALDMEDKSFDYVLAAEVLEHIPYAEFETSLRQLGRVARKRVVITLPAPLIGGSVLVNLPLFKPRGLSIGLPFKVRHRFDGEHYWELGKHGYSKRRIRNSIQSAGLAIEKEYRPAPSLFSYFFLLRPKSGTETS